jgi:hypothetical protein
LAPVETLQIIVTILLVTMTVVVKAPATGLVAIETKEINPIIYLQKAMILSGVWVPVIISIIALSPSY